MGVEAVTKSGTLILGWAKQFARSEHHKRLWEDDAWSTHYEYMKKTQYVGSGATTWLNTEGVMKVDGGLLTYAWQVQEDTGIDVQDIWDSVRWIHGEFRQRAKIQDF